MSSADLFDPAWYDAAYREDIGGAADEAHYRAVGEGRGYKPNALFDPLIWSLARGRTNPTGALSAFIAEGRPPMAFTAAEAFAAVPRPPLVKADRPPAKSIARDADRTNAVAHTLGRATVTLLPTSHGERRLICPAADDLLGRLERDEPFAFARLPHGFWDCLYQYDLVRADLAQTAGAAALSAEHLDRLNSRLLDEWFPGRGVYGENFLPEIIGDIATLTPERFMTAVAFNPMPNADDRPFWALGEPSEGSLAAADAFDRTFPAEAPVYDANAWKRWVFSGDILKLPDLARRRPVVLIAAEQVRDLAHRWTLPWFEQVEIPDDGSYPFRYEILDRCLAAADRAKSTAARVGGQRPLVLLQGGSFAYWLIARLARHDPDLFYMDFGQALHAWFLDVDTLYKSKWATLHAEPIMRNGFGEFYARQGLTLPEPYANYAVSGLLY